MTSKERAFYQSIGICPKCCKNVLTGDEKTCLECKALNAEYKAIKYESDIEYRRKFIQSVSNSKRLRKQRRREQGLCIECGKRPPKKGIATCEWCREKANARKREKYEPLTKRKQWIENGLCFLCGDECDPGYKVCKRHHQITIDNAQTENYICHRKELAAIGWNRIGKKI